MISIYHTNFGDTATLADLSVVSACPLGFSGSELNDMGLSAGSSARTTALAGMPVRPVRVTDERATTALEAGVAAAEAQAYAFAAASAGTQKQKKHHHKMWAFRGLEPWSDPV